MQGQHTGGPTSGRNEPSTCQPTLCPDVCSCLDTATLDILADFIHRAGLFNSGVVAFTLPDFSPFEELRVKARMLKPNTSEQLDAAAFPVRAKAFCKALAALAGKWTNAITKASGFPLDQAPYRPSYRINSMHPLENLIEHTDHGLKSGQNSTLVISNSQALPSHIDRGLFNIILGSPSDMLPLEIFHQGGWVSVSNLFKNLSNVSKETMVGVLMPGLTLQLLDPRYKAVEHRVVSCVAPPHDEVMSSRGVSREPRVSIVYGWRLNPELQLPNGQGRLGTIVTSLHSARDGLNITVQYGLNRYWKLKVSPSCSVRRLTRAIHELGGPPEYEQRLIFGGERMKDNELLCTTLRMEIELMCLQHR